MSLKITDEFSGKKLKIRLEKHEPLNKKFNYFICFYDKNNDINYALSFNNYEESRKLFLLLKRGTIV